jgi:hypothetical protein
MLDIKGGAEAQTIRLLHEGAADALGAIGPAAQSAIPALLKVADERGESDTARAAAVEALGKMGSAGRVALPLLKKLVGEIRNSNDALGKAADEAMRRLAAAQD